MFPEVEIYAISTDAEGVRYVGRTTSSLRMRFNGHACARTEVGEWIRDNADTVTIRCLAEATHANASQLEREWIERYREAGNNMFNKWPETRKFERAMSDLDKMEAERKDRRLSGKAIEQERAA